MKNGKKCFRFHVDLCMHFRFVYSFAAKGISRKQSPNKKRPAIASARRYDTFESQIVCQKGNESERRHGSKEEKQIRVCARDMPTAQVEHLRLRAMYYSHQMGRCSATSSTVWMVRVNVCLVWIVSLLDSAELMQFIYFSRKKNRRKNHSVMLTCERGLVVVPAAW